MTAMQLCQCYYSSFSVCKIGMSHWWAIFNNIPYPLSSVSLHAMVIYPPLNMHCATTATLFDPVERLSQCILYLYI